MERSKLSALEETSAKLLEDVVTRTRSVEEELARIREEFWISQTTLEAHIGKLERSDENLSKDLDVMVEDMLYIAWKKNKDMNMSFTEDPDMRTKLESHLKADTAHEAQEIEASAASQIPEDNPMVELVTEVPSGEGPQ